MMRLKACSGQKLYKEAKRFIPGGTQLLSKRPEMFLPELWPAYYSKALGCKIWDLDGNKYTDMSSMGVGSCILGYADSDINRAVKSVIDKGNMCTLNAPEEVILARLLIKLHPWAEMVRYARTGGEAMAVAIRIARAKTRKDLVLFCGYHGWHDWYLSANLSSNRVIDGHLLPGLNPLGVPRKLRGTTLTFKYNDKEGFLRLVNKHRDKIGAIVMETIRNVFPEKGFLHAVTRAADKLKVPLIVDEITSGFRLNNGGAHLLFGINPDIAVFAKGISNGFPMAAIIGKRDVMEAAQDTFISSTYWTDRIGPAAALATIKKLHKNNVPAYLIKAGRTVQIGWERLALKHKIKIEISGICPLSHFRFINGNPLVLKTLFCQCMLDSGFLASSDFYASFSHTEVILDRYLSAVDNTFGFIRKAIENGNPEKYLKSSVCQSGFKRLT